MTALQPIEANTSLVHKSSTDTVPNAGAYEGDTFNICLLGYRSHPHVGGQGIYINYLSKALVDLGHKVDVISGQPYPELDPRVNLIKMPSLDLFAAKDHVTALRPRHLKSFSDTFEWFTMLTGGFAEPYTFGRRVVKYLKNQSHQYDIVHDNQCLAYGLLSLQTSGLPTVATVHHPITRDRKLALDAARNWKQRLLIRRWHSFLNMQARVVKKLEHIITVSEQSRQDIASEFKRPIDTIDLMYNGIDTEVFRALPHIEREEHLLITTASADQPLKGLRYLLEALALLRPQYPDLKLLVIGKLRLGGDTERRLQKLQLMSAVEFVSGISTESLVEHYNRATVAISPSLYEGFGLPAGEAMACETPVISSDGGALPEVVGDAGLIVPKANDLALAEAIEQMLKHPDRRRAFGIAGRQRIQEKFSWAVKARRLSHYYNNIIKAQTTKC